MTYSSKIGPLTSLRFFAAFYVVLFHTAHVAFPMVQDPSRWHGRVLDMGFVSVSFFFTLSGYILARVYLSSAVPLDRKRFWVARFARIYPLFLLSLFLDVPFYFFPILVHLGPSLAFQWTLTRVFACSFMLQAWWPSLKGIDNPNWSLAVEAVFYALFPFVAPIVVRMSWKKLFACAPAVYLLGLLLLLAAGKTHASEDVLKFNPVLHLHEFLFGIILGKLHLTVQHLEAARSRLAAGAWPMLAAASAFCGMVLWQYMRIPKFLIHDGLLVPAYACILLAFGSGNRSIDTIFSRPSLVLLGESSYALYLLHIPVWHLLTQFHLERRLWIYPLYLAAVISLSICSLVFVETPTRRWIVQRYSKADVPHPAGIAAVKA